MTMKPSEMNENIDNLCPLDVTELNGLITDFALYLDIAGKPVLYADGSYQWSLDEIERLNHDGFSVLFYEKANNQKVSVLLGVPDSTPEKDSEVNHKQERVAQLITACLEWIRSIHLDQEQKTLAEEACVQVLETISENATLVEHMHALSEHDYYSFYHSMRTAAYGAVIAVKIGSYDARALHDIILGCVIHDVGHLKVSKDILEKRERLNEKEWFEIKQHPLHGIAMLDDVPLSNVTKEMILHHHEREDGHGYPHGIKGHELTQEVKIIAFCDIFDALTSPRPYQKPVALEEALGFIEENALEYLDRRSFEAMKELIMNHSIKVPA